MSRVPERAFPLAIADLAKEAAEAMFELTPFTWKGWTVSLTGHYTDAGAWLWTAAIDGTDYVYVAPGKPGDDVERVRHLIRDWIDDRMPNGGPGA